MNFEIFLEMLVLTYKKVCWFRVPLLMTSIQVSVIKSHNPTSPRLIRITTAIRLFTIEDKILIYRF